MSTIGGTLTSARAALKQALGLDEREAGLEAHILLGHALSKPRAYLLAHRDEAADPAAFANFHALLQRRLLGEPIAYILGEREFFALTLRVTPDVLIPRQDTELLVELALARAPEHEACDVLDLGTGSGAVAITIAKHRPAANVTAIDQSGAALAVAQDNARRLKVANIRFIQGSWFAPLDKNARFDVIVGNPPYIAEQDPHLEQGDLRFEPSDALVSGADGLDAIRTIVAEAASHLKPNGQLLLEHGFEQGAACRGIFAVHGFRGIFSHRDLAGHERATVGSPAQRSP